MNRNQIGFIGAGTMGSEMIRHLVRRGYLVKVFNRTRKRALNVANDNCYVVESPYEAAKGSAAVLSCVSDDQASDSVWLGPNGAIGGAQHQTLAIELSTLSLPYFNDWAKRVLAAKLIPIDAPVTGSKAGAEAGDLTAFVGASKLCDASSAILSTFCSKQITFGSLGAGLRFKLVYNMVGAGIGAVFAEGLNLLDRLELRPDLCLDTFITTGWASGVARSKGEMMLQHNYEPAAFKAKHMLKDLEFALHAARATNASVPLAQLVTSLYSSAVDAGQGNLDFSTVREVNHDVNR